MVKLMQGHSIGTGSFREDDIEDDIDFRVALRGVLASTGWWDKEQFLHQIIGLHGFLEDMYGWSWSNYWKIILSSHWHIVCFFFQIIINILLLASLLLGWFLRFGVFFIQVTKKYPETLSKLLNESKRFLWEKKKREELIHCIVFFFNSLVR